MFHRRPQRRIVRPFQPLPLGPRRALVEANQLKEAGRFAEAAAIFERLVQAARERGMSERLPLLLVQAGHCRLLSGENPAGLQQIKDGLAMLQAQRKWNALQLSGEAAVRELARLGETAAAGELHSWLESAMSGRPAEVAARPASASPSATAGIRLPARCPSCGAGLRSDQVEWIDESYVECPYCGSSVPLGSA